MSDGVTQSTYSGMMWCSDEMLSSLKHSILCCTGRALVKVASFCMTGLKPYCRVAKDVCHSLPHFLSPLKSENSPWSHASLRFPGHNEYLDGQASRLMNTSYSPRLPSFWLLGCSRLDFAQVVMFLKILQRKGWGLSSSSEQGKGVLRTAEKKGLTWQISLLLCLSNLTPPPLKKRQTRGSQSTQALLSYQ